MKGIHDKKILNEINTAILAQAILAQAISSKQCVCTIPIPVEFDRSMSVSRSSNPAADVDMRVSSKRGIVEVAPFGSPASQKIDRIEYKKVANELLSCLPHFLQNNVMVRAPFAANYQISFGLKDGGGWDSCRAVQEALIAGVESNMIMCVVIPLRSRSSFRRVGKIPWQTCSGLRHS